jgi:RNA polymerase sigma factor (TIGR02999 family)
MSDDPESCPADLVRAWRAGDPKATEAINQQTYATLKRIARRQAGGVHSAQSMSATSVVNETVASMLEGNVDLLTRVHFHALATLRMRAVLVDHARRRRSAKRGGGVTFVTLNEATEVDSEEKFLDLHEALGVLENEDARTAKVIELTYFGGLSAAEVGEVVGASVATVERDLAFGRVWLRAALSK